MPSFESVRPIVLCYHSIALVAATGGALGWKRAGSKISLIAGLGIGVLFVTAARLTAQSGYTSMGLYLGTATSSLLAWRMAMRALNKTSNSSMFPVTVAMLSAATAVYSVVQCNKRGFI